jgi:hypothetical protein
MCQFSHLLSPHSFIMDAHRRTTRGGSLEAGTNFVEAHTIMGICVAHEMAVATSHHCSLALPFSSAQCIHQHVSGMVSGGSSSSSSGSSS